MAKTKSSRYLDTLSTLGCRIWFLLRASDLEPVPLRRQRSDPMGLDPSESGWGSILGMGYREESHLEWALAHGVAPGQPFLMEIDPPEHTKTWTDCGYEYDINYSAELVAVAPLAFHEAASRWEAWLWNAAEWRAAKEKQDAAARAESTRRLALAKTDAASLFLEADLYHARGDALDWMPSGLRIHLNSAHLSAGRWGLVSGEDDRGDREVAMQKLLERAATELPHLRPEFIRALPWNRPHVGRDNEAQKGT